MTRFFALPEVRLFLRALLAAAVTFSMKFVDSTGHVTYSSAGLHAAIVAAALVFAEIFTPINSLLGLFSQQASSVEAPPAPIQPPGDTTEVRVPAKKAA
jgi:hypothetical protein